MNDRDILDALSRIPRDCVVSRNKLYAVWFSASRRKPCIISPDGGKFNL